MESDILCIEIKCITLPDGTKVWYQNGKRHRTDGPAVERENGDKYWYQNGKLHRLDGPVLAFLHVRSALQ